MNHLPVNLHSYQDQAPEPLIQALRSQGWCWTEQLLPDALIQALSAAARQLPDHQLQAAGIGRAQQHTQDASIRRDKTRWLSGATPVEQAFLAQMTTLQRWLNEHLLLGLFDFEAHYARYQPGDFYRKHLDALHGERNRVLSSVIYLNAAWPADGGGELVLYDEHQTTQELVRIRPEQGHAVFFLSEAFPHEVLPSRLARHSIAGWFRVRPCQP